MLACIIALLGTNFYFYLTTLIFLGVGWNFLFVGGSSVIADSASLEERGRVQGVADFCIFSFVAVGSMLSGMLHSEFGWTFMITISCLPIIIISIAIIFSPFL